MKKYLLLFAMVLTMSATFAAKIVTGGALTGYIDDSMCAGGKSMCNSGNRVVCAQKCIKSGASAVLVVGDKVYKVSNQKAVVKYAGKNVTVEGKITGETIEVTKVTLVKA